MGFPSILKQGRYQIEVHALFRREGHLDPEGAGGRCLGRGTCPGKRGGITQHFIQAGKPTQKAFIEIFNGKIRECSFGLHRFASIEDARSEIDNWQRHYNHVRLHRSFGKKLPAAFAKEAA